MPRKTHIGRTIRMPKKITKTNIFNRIIIVRECVIHINCPMIKKKKKNHFSKCFTPRPRESGKHDKSEIIVCTYETPFRFQSNA